MSEQSRTEHIVGRAMRNNADVLDVTADRIVCAARALARNAPESYCAPNDADRIAAAREDLLSAADDIADVLAKLRSVASYGR